MPCSYFDSVQNIYFPESISQVTYSDGHNCCLHVVVESLTRWVTILPKVWQLMHMRLTLKHPNLKLHINTSFSFSPVPPVYGIFNQGLYFSTKLHFFSVMNRKNHFQMTDDLLMRSESEHNY